MQMENKEVLTVTLRATIAMNIFKLVQKKAHEKLDFQKSYTKKVFTYDSVGHVGASIET